jgi:hypothetical protein
MNSEWWLSLNGDVLPVLPGDVLSHDNNNMTMISLSSLIKDELYNKSLLRIKSFKLQEILSDCSTWMIQYQFGNVIVPARDFIKCAIEDVIRQGVRTRTGKLEECKVTMLAEFHGWKVLTTKLDRQRTTTDVILIKDARILVYNIKSNKRYGNAVDGTIPEMVKFIKDGNYVLPDDAGIYGGQSLSEIKTIEILIGGRTTEKCFTEVVENITVNHRFGTAFFEFLGITETITITINNEEDSIPFPKQREIALDSKTEELYIQLVMTHQGKFRGVQIVVDHDKISIPALERARMIVVS